MPVTTVATTPRPLPVDPIRAWDVLADFAGWREWNPTFTAKGRAVAGGRLLLRPRIAPLLVLPARIRACERGISLSWGGGGPFGVRAEHVLRLEATDAGCTLHHHEDFEGPLGLATAPLRSLLVSRYTAMDAALAELLTP